MRFHYVSPDFALVPALILLSFFAMSSWYGRIGRIALTFGSMFFGLWGIPIRWVLLVVILVVSVRSEWQKRFNITYSFEEVGSQIVARDELTRRVQVFNHTDSMPLRIHSQYLELRRAMKRLRG
jgi:hypothetical protein